MNERRVGWWGSGGLWALAGADVGPVTAKFIYTKQLLAKNMGRC
jgi:hypothetical protein